jgi:PDZ domain-containing protein
LWVKLLGGIALLAAACVGLAFVPTGDVAYAPVAPIDLDGKVRVDGAPTEPLQGHLSLVGVAERRVNLLQRLLLDVSDPAVDFGPAPSSTQAGPADEDVQAMAQAKRVAAGVAFELAGEPVSWDSTGGATVSATVPGTPAGQALRPGDIIVRVNGRDVDSSVDAGRIINALPPGSRVVLGIQRGGVALQPTLRTLPPEQGDPVERHSRIGVELSTIGLRVVLPRGRSVDIDSGDVVGPSAGLAFALYVFDALSPKDLLQGRHVVASGAISPDGIVLPVGRIRQKAIAAQAANRDVLLVPAANADEARAAIKAACADAGRCIQVVPVQTVREAVELLLLEPGQLQARGSGAAAAA